MRSHAPDMVPETSVFAPKFLCQCSDCRKETCLDPKMSLRVQGCLVPSAIRQAHDALSRSRAIASAHIAEASGLYVKSTIKAHSEGSSVAPEHRTTYPQSRPSKKSPVASRSQGNRSKPKVFPRSSYPLASRKGWTPKAGRGPSASRTPSVEVRSSLQTLKNMAETITHGKKFSGYACIKFNNPPHSRSSPLKDGGSLPAFIWDLDVCIRESIEVIGRRDYIREAIHFIEQTNQAYSPQSTAVRLQCSSLRMRLCGELTAIEQSLRSEWNRQLWVLTEANGACISLGECNSRIVRFCLCA